MLTDLVSFIPYILTLTSVHSTFYLFNIGLLFDQFQRPYIGLQHRNSDSVVQGCQTPFPSGATSRPM